MKVAELMTRSVLAARPYDSLARAAQIMWENDCGGLPVIDDAGGVVGMITDRDVCMAAYTQGKPLAEITVDVAQSRSAFTVSEEESIENAEAEMRRHQVRRLPVVDAAGHLSGILSLGDLARHLHRWSFQANGLGADSIAYVLAAVSTPEKLRAMNGR
jgi:CBS domain-containing protein